MSREVQIVEQIGANRFVVKCARCDGSGRARPLDLGSKACWVCAGRATLYLEVVRPPLVPCHRCKGSGRRVPWDQESKECRTCKGAGCQPTAGEAIILR